MNFCAGEEIDPGYVALAVEEANFDGLDRRRFVWPATSVAEALEGFRVAIIGAGLGGICAAIRLEQAGIPYTVFDKNPDVGGTWFENTYPDLRVDVPNHFYSYSFAPNPDWSDYYARREELAGVHRMLCGRVRHRAAHPVRHRGDRRRVRRRARPMDARHPG